MNQQHKVLITPLLFVIIYAVWQMMLAPIAFIILIPEIVHLDAYAETFLLEILFLTMLIAGWKLSARFGLQWTDQLLTRLSFGYTNKNFAPSLLKGLVVSFYTLFVLSFVGLMLTSGAGLLWITSSRTAYQNYRNGVGVFWAAGICGLLLSYIFCLFLGPERKTKISPALRIALKTLFYMASGYFLGSKAVILGVFVVGFAHYNFTVKPVRWQGLAIAGAIILVAFGTLQIVQGTAGDVRETILYAEYFHNTSEFLRRFDEFGGYRYGSVGLSSLWQYVPRGIYPGKPYVYGLLQVNELLWPGLTETGNTPGLAGWTADYLDWGILGVMSSGIQMGLIIGLGYRYFLSRPSNPLRYIIMLQIGQMAPIFYLTSWQEFLLLGLPLVAGAPFILRALFGVSSPQNPSLPLAERGAR